MLHACTAAGLCRGSATCEHFFKKSSHRVRKDLKDVGQNRASLTHVLKFGHTLREVNAEVWTHLKGGQVNRLAQHRDTGWQLHILQQLWGRHSAPLKSHLQASDAIPGQTLNKVAKALTSCQEPNMSGRASILVVCKSGCVMVEAGGQFC